MKQLIEAVGWSMFMLLWTGGIVLAPGWLKLCAIFVPPYGWYLIVERAMQAMGVIP